MKTTTSPTWNNYHGIVTWKSYPAIITVKYYWNIYHENFQWQIHKAAGEGYEQISRSLW